MLTAAAAATVSTVNKIVEAINTVGKAKAFCAYFFVSIITYMIPSTGLKLAKITHDALY